MKTLDDSPAANRACSSHDDGEQPKDVSYDASPDHLNMLKMNYYQAHVVVDQKKQCEIERSKKNHCV